MKIEIFLKDSKGKVIRNCWCEHSSTDEKEERKKVFNYYNRLIKLPFKSN